MKARIPEEHGGVAWDWGGEGLISLARKGARMLARSRWWELRVRARRELGLPLDRPVVASGHQPLFVHPGILLRQLFLGSLPREVEAVWVCVDSDAPGEVGYPVPLLRRFYTFHRLVLLENPSRRILAALPAPDEETLARAWAHMERRLGTLKNCAILARARRFWQTLPPPDGNWPGWLERAKRRAMGAARPRVLSLTAMTETRSFREFVRLLTETDGFPAAYREAAAGVGIPPLPQGGLPFWSLDREGRRLPAHRPQDCRLPRALTLTLFLRAVVCDFFLHGAGGAGYEPAVDRLFQEGLGVSPPPWGWLTGTFLLPEPAPDRRLPGREYPFFLHDLGELRASLAVLSAAL